MHEQENVPTKHLQENSGILSSMTTQPPAPESAPLAGTPWPAPGQRLSPELVVQFFSEASDHLTGLEPALLAFEKNPHDKEVVNRVFRLVHSIKGTADYVGLAQIKTLSHQLENVLDLARKGQLTITPCIFDLVFEAADELRSMISSLQRDAEQNRDLSDLINRLDSSTQNGMTGQPKAPDLPAQVAADPQLAVFIKSACQHIGSVQVCRQKIAAGDQSQQVISALHRAAKTLITAATYMGHDEFIAPARQIQEIVELFREGRAEFDALMLNVIDEQTDALSHLLETIREVNVPPPTTQRLGDILCEQQVVAREQLEEAVHAPMRIGDRIVAQGLATREQVEAVAVIQTSKTPPAKATTARTMRVNQEKLDAYMNLAGELLIARNGLLHTFQTLQAGKATLREMKEAIDGVNRISAEIQDNAMAMRMIPVSSVFQRFPRMIRDIARTLGKQIEIQIHGEDTELDKQVAEALGDPLVHLVRNAADHGIESLAGRRAAGKNDTGMIALSAAREGGSIVINIIDDGAGIPVDLLKAKAIETGVITRDRADAMSRQEALALIFSPGLTTAKSVSDISGRGVGMDVVRSNIAALGGAVAISSEEGKGSKITIRLPLTLAVSTVVLVRSGSCVYGIPIEAVQETVKIAPAHMNRINGEYLLSLRGNVMGIKELSQLMSTAEYSDTISKSRADRTNRVPVVVVSASGVRYGLMVEELLGQQDIVVKPLPGCLADLPGLGGATIMGDGSIVLVLDPVRLFDLVVAQGSPRTAA